MMRSSSNFWQCFLNACTLICNLYVYFLPCIFTRLFCNYWQTRCPPSFMGQSLQHSLITEREKRRYRRTPKMTTSDFFSCSSIVTSTWNSSTREKLWWIKCSLQITTIYELSLVYKATGDCVYYFPLDKGRARQLAVVRVQQSGLESRFYWNGWPWSQSVLCKIYVSLVRPCLEYASVVLGSYSTADSFFLFSFFFWNASDCLWLILAALCPVCPSLKFFY